MTIISCLIFVKLVRLIKEQWILAKNLTQTEWFQLHKRTQWSSRRLKCVKDLCTNPVVFLVKSNKCYGSWPYILLIVKREKLLLSL